VVGIFRELCFAKNSSFFELMRMFKKGQLGIWKLGQGLTGEIGLIERQFGIYKT